MARLQYLQLVGFYLLVFVFLREFFDLPQVVLDPRVLQALLGREPLIVIKPHHPVHEIPGAERHLLPVLPLELNASLFVLAEDFLVVPAWEGYASTQPRERLVSCKVLRCGVVQGEEDNARTEDIRLCLVVLVEEDFRRDVARGPTVPEEIGRAHV